MTVTHHEKGIGSPDDLCNGGISWRAMQWYDLAMGGVAANGVEAGNINTVGIDNLTADLMPDLVDFEIFWKVSDTNPKSSDITVKLTAKKTFPVNTHLHLFVYQNRINWMDEYGIPPMNGQK